MLFIDLHDLRCIVTEHSWRNPAISVVDDDVLVRIIHLVLLINHTKVIDSYHDCRFLLSDQYPTQGEMFDLLYDLTTDIEAHLHYCLNCDEVKLGRKLNIQRTGRFVIFTTA